MRVLFGFLTALFVFGGGLRAQSYPFRARADIEGCFRVPCRPVYPSQPIYSPPAYPSAPIYYPPPPAVPQRRQLPPRIRLIIERGIDGGMDIKVRPTERPPLRYYLNGNGNGNGYARPAAYPTYSSGYSGGYQNGYAAPRAINGNGYCPPGGYCPPVSYCAPVRRGG